ncbi:MAG: DUF1311 domain-containing protein [Neomegalonema sp.]|nr:DUF1311 domain-containing protein [Neomegalonema sp.]
MLITRFDQNTRLHAARLGTASALALMLAFGAALPAMAQEGQAAAHQQIEQCLQRSMAEGRPPELCIGQSTTECIDQGPEHQTTLGMMACTQASLNAWEALLERHYHQALSQVPPQGRADLEQAQEAWQVYRENACKVWYAMFEGGSMAPLSAASCLATLTARRAIDLKEINEAGGI